MTTFKQLAGVSIDLDNKWSYLKTRNDEHWRELPSFYPTVIPRVVEFFEKRNLTISCFVVGQDAVLPEHIQHLQNLTKQGHELGNHSFHHEAWKRFQTLEEAELEIHQSEQAIEAATGVRPVGYRGPGFSLQPEILQVLASRKYQYDTSTWPTFFGPLARMFYSWKTGLSGASKQERNQLFGRVSDCFQPNKLYVLQPGNPRLVEIPVTVMPLVRTPAHISYLMYLATFSATGALAYFETFLTLCRVTQTPPVILLHPTDFLSVQDEPELAFFPGMSLPLATKLNLLNTLFDRLGAHYRPVRLIELAQSFSIPPLPRASL